MLDGKLQLKNGQTIAVIKEPYEVEVAAGRASTDAADAVLVFVKNRAELEQRIAVLQDAAARGALAWFGVPESQAAPHRSEPRHHSRSCAGPRTRSGTPGIDQRGLVGTACQVARLIWRMRIRVSWAVETNRVARERTHSCRKATLRWIASALHR